MLARLALVPSLARHGFMNTSTQALWILIVINTVFALDLVPMDEMIRAFIRAVILIIGGWTIAFLRSRKLTRSQRDTNDR
jgi:hypothetical protein